MLVCDKKNTPLLSLYLCIDVYKCIHIVTFFMLFIHTYTHIHTHTHTYTHTYTHDPEGDLYIVYYDCTVYIVYYDCTVYIVHYDCTVYNHSDMSIHRITQPTWYFHSVKNRCDFGQNNSMYYVNILNGCWIQCACVCVCVCVCMWV